MISTNHKGKYDLIRMNAHDLARKNLIPEYSIPMIVNSNFSAQARNELKYNNRGFRCKECGIEIESEIMMNEHVKIHWTREQRENETDIVRVNPY